jgi:pimeloyl-ACP methyl ester carboxylesterase
MVMASPRIEVIEVVVDGVAGRAHVGGAGEPLVLIHGGWGDAAAHWAPVWERLASDFRVVAPELPGLSRRAPEAGLGSVAAYARWVAGVLEGHAPGPAWLAGNSFGASVAWRLAAELGPRCRGVVLVNGFPMPRTPALLALLGRVSAARALFREAWRRSSFTPAALERAFVDPARAPAELAAVARDPDPRQIAAFTDVLVAGDPGPAPAVPTLLLWGEGDRLPRTTAADARRLARDIPGATLELVADAGHLPQVEQPDAFVDALMRFAGARRAGTAARADV